MTPWYHRPINRWVYRLAVPAVMVVITLAPILLLAGIGWLIANG